MQMTVFILKAGRNSHVGVLYEEFSSWALVSPTAPSAQWGLLRRLILHTHTLSLRHTHTPSYTSDSCFMRTNLGLLRCLGRRDTDSTGQKWGLSMKSSIQSWRNSYRNTSVHRLSHCVTKYDVCVYVTVRENMTSVAAEEHENTWLLTYYLTRDSHKPPVTFQARWQRYSLDSPSDQTTSSHYFSSGHGEEIPTFLQNVTESESFRTNPFLCFQFNGPIEFFPHKWNVDVCDCKVPRGNTPCRRLLEEILGTAGRIYYITSI